MTVTAPTDKSVPLQRADVLGRTFALGDNAAMDDERALLLAALGRTLAAAAAAALGVADPKLAELLATGVAQHGELAAGHSAPDDDGSVVGAPRAGDGRYIVTISGPEQDQCVRRQTLLEARCAVDGAALLAGLTARDCRCEKSSPHGTLVDAEGSVAALFDIAREERR